jgi:hypothetical protein
MSAAAAKGYKLDSSTKLYKALHSLTQIGTKDFRTRMGNITTDAD